MSLVYVYVHLCSYAMLVREHVSISGEVGATIYLALGTVLCEVSRAKPYA